MCPVKQEPLRPDCNLRHTHDKEAQRILERLSGRDVIVALDSSGRLLTSPEFAHYIDTCTQKGRSYFTFVVGGPIGLSPTIVQRSDLVMSLSPMTFSHELTILALVEQLYRAVAFLRDHPYPK